MLIMQASDKKLNTDKLHTLLHISFLTVGELVRYRYNVATARLMGCEDFYRGPEYFIQTDPAKKHADLGVLNYSFISPEEAGIRQADIERLMKQENNIVKKKRQLNSRHSYKISSLSVLSSAAACRRH